MNQELFPRPSRRQPAVAVAKAMEAIGAMLEAGDKITGSAVAARAGISKTAALKAIGLHARGKEAARKAATFTVKALSEDQQLAEAKFSDRGKLSIERAIALHKRRLDKAWEATVNDEVRRRIAAADDSTRKALADLRRQEHSWRTEMAKRGVFTRAEFRALLMCCHPDASASAETRARLLAILTKNEHRLVSEV